MTDELIYWEAAGLLFTLVFGMLLHFFYQWSGGKQIVGRFAPVNESIWEHLKLLFFPIVLFSIAEYFFIGKEYPNFIPAKALSVTIGMLLIVVLFYIYTVIIGGHRLWADILLFVLGAVAAYAYSLYIISQPSLGIAGQLIGAGIIIVFILCFAVFSYDPPHIPLFADPNTKGYGPVGSAE